MQAKLCNKVNTETFFAHDIKYIFRGKRRYQISYVNFNVIQWCKLRYFSSFPHEWYVFHSVLSIQVINSLDFVKTQYKVYSYLSYCQHNPLNIIPGKFHNYIVLSLKWQFTKTLILQNQGKNDKKPFVVFRQE